MKDCAEINETITSILEEAIKSEIDSEKKYLHGAKIACDPQVKEVLLSLAGMEHEHKEILTKKLQELRAQMTVVNQMNEMFE
ncbi:MAG TPA: ferritin family protein [Candidatus Kryptonia bacterium]